MCIYTMQLYYIRPVANYFDVHLCYGYSAANELSASLDGSVVHLELNYSKV